MPEFDAFYREHCCQGKHRRQHQSDGYNGSVLGIVIEPPSQPEEEDTYLIGADAIGEFYGHDWEVAYYRAEEWNFVSPMDGCLLWLKPDKMLWIFDDEGIGWDRYIVTGEPFYYSDGEVPPYFGD